MIPNPHNCLSWLAMSICYFAVNFCIPSHVHRQLCTQYIMFKQYFTCMAVLLSALLFSAVHMMQGFVYEKMQ
jgi:hypothetical protein